MEANRETRMSDHGWGQMNAGVFRTQMTLDLDRAFAAMKSTIAERILIQHIREISWNASIRKKLTSKDAWPEPIPCELNLTELSISTGISYRTLGRAKQALLDDRIIIPMRHGVTVNKNVYLWAKSRLTSVQVAYAKEGQTVSHPRVTSQLTNKEHSDKSEHAPRQTVTQTEGETRFGHDLSQCSAVHYDNLRPLTVSNDCFTPSTVISKTGVRPRACEDDFSSLPELNSSLLTTPPLERFLTGGGGGVGEEKESDSGDQRPQTIAQMSAWFARQFRCRVADNQVQVLATGFPLDWVYESLRMGLLNCPDDPRRVLTYANSLLFRWRNAGGMTIVRDGPKEVAPPAPAAPTARGSEYASLVAEGIEKRKAARRAAKEAESNGHD
jgi:hypothetical protein